MIKMEKISIFYIIARVLLSTGKKIIEGERLYVYKKCRDFLFEYAVFLVSALIKTIRRNSYTTQNER
jgi:hypothetical protein